MVEREAQIPGDRPKIAAVIYNRLAAGMPLGIDASIYYAVELETGIATYTHELTEAQLHIDSPYNTRTHTGLPPTPISNPGEASIEAAAHPAQVAYLYYVAGADGCGEQVFSDTSPQFEANAAAYKAAVREERRATAGLQAQVMRRLGVLGWPVAHSRSPAMHNAALAALGLPDWHYQRLPVPPALFAETTRALGAAGFVGANVTIPHKRAALALAIERERGRARDRRRQHAHVRPRRRDRGREHRRPRPDRRARRLPARRRHARARARRGRERPRGRCGRCARPAPPRSRSGTAPPSGRWRSREEFGVRAVALDAGGPARTAPRSDCGHAPSGLRRRRASEGPELALELSASERRGLNQLGLTFDQVGEYANVVDLVYTSHTTDLLAAAGAHGAHTVDGLEILVAQGALSLEMWTGRTPPLEVMRSAARGAVDERRRRSAPKGARHERGPEDGPRPARHLRDGRRGRRATSSVISVGRALGRAGTTASAKASSSERGGGPRHRRSTRRIVGAPGEWTSRTRSSSTSARTPRTPRRGPPQEETTRASRALAPGLLTALPDRRDRRHGPRHPRGRRGGAGGLARLGHDARARAGGAGARSTRTALARALAERYGLDHLDLGVFWVNMAAANLVSTTVAKRYQAVPVAFADKRTLLVAMADPSNVLAVDDIAIMTGYEIRVAVAPPDDIVDAGLAPGPARRRRRRVRRGRRGRARKGRRSSPCTRPPTTRP